MIKTGIYNLSQLTTNNQFKGFFGGAQRISITLYNQILNLPNANELAERICLLFTDERGAYKRTYANRFSEFDTKAIELIKQQFPNQEHINIHDVAVSDGRTAVDFFASLVKEHQNLSYQASDYNPKVLVIKDGETKVTLSSNNKVLEVLWAPFVFSAVRPDKIWKYPVNRLLQLFVDRTKVRPLIKKYISGKIEASELFLFSPMALNLASSDSRFSLLQHDILQPFNSQSQSHIIRAMNVLNASYFSKAEFKIVLQNMHAQLRTNGLLITGSNQDSGSIVNGGVYQKTVNGFKELWRSGNGSPIKIYLQD
jgi:hypothetical protein